MQRKEDFAERRVPLQALSDEQLKERFWELAGAIVDPMITIAKNHTSPSIERSVLMRMGFSSVVAKEIVAKCLEYNLLGKGAGHCVIKLADLRNCDYLNAGNKLANDDGWNDLQVAWKTGGRSQ